MITLESIQQELKITNYKMDLILKRFMPDSELISISMASKLLGCSKSKTYQLIKDHPEFICKQVKGHNKIYRKMIEDYCKSKIK